jgi:hypothetical protein
MENTICYLKIKIDLVINYSFLGTTIQKDKIRTYPRLDTKLCQYKNNLK